MAIAYKILGTAYYGGQSSATLASTTVYTVPAGTQAVISSINIVSVNTLYVNSSSQFGIYAVKSGQSQSASNAVIVGTTILAGRTNNYNLGLTLGAGDSIVLTAAMGVYAAEVFGGEIT
jgi:hypothetical protein